MRLLPRDTSTAFFGLDLLVWKAERWWDSVLQFNLLAPSKISASVRHFCTLSSSNLYVSKVEGASTATGIQWCYSFLKSLLTNCALLCLNSPVPPVPQGAEQWELQYLQQGGSGCTSQLYSSSTALSPWSPEGLPALLHHENTELDSSLCSENVFRKPQVKSYFNFHSISPFAASLSGQQVKFWLLWKPLTKIQASGSHNGVRISPYMSLTFLILGDICFY